MCLQFKYYINYLSKYRKYFLIKKNKIWNKILKNYLHKE